MNIDAVRLSAYLSSRLCHDLVSPIASVTNALDLLDEPGDAEQKQLYEDSLREAADKAKNTIMFLRYAFGSVGLQVGTADLHEFKRITEGYVRGYKPSIEWDITTDMLGFSHARLVMNMVMMAMPSLGRGGVIHVKVRDEAAGKTVTVTCKGDRVSLKEDVARAARGEEPEGGWRAENIQPYFSRLICDSLGGELHARQSADAVIFMATGLRNQA